jgi:hypothetical protein
MNVIRGIILGLLIMLVTACTTTPGKTKVYCPACGAEYNAYIETRF